MSVTVFLRVRATPSDWGSSLCVVGNLPQLSSWAASSPLPLQSAGDYFTCTLTLPCDTDIEYKYVLVDDKGVIRWEPVPTVNRILFTGSEGATIAVDDGEFGSDEHVSVTRFESSDATSAEKEQVDNYLNDEEDDHSGVEDQPSEEDEPLEKKQSALLMEDIPTPFVDATRETIALADELDAARSNVESLRCAIRSIRGVPPPTCVDEEVHFPPSEKMEVAAADANIATELVQHCLTDGNALLGAMRAKVNVTKKLRTKAEQPGAHALAVASIAACAAIIIALTIINPQIAREARKRTGDVRDFARGVVAEKSWKEALVLLWERMKAGLEEAKEQACEKAGWPKICGQKKRPIVKVVESKVVSLTKGILQWMEDNMRALTGRRKQTAVETAWLTLPRTLRKLLEAALDR